MSLKYAEQKIKEALVQTKGNMARARQLVIKWSQDDPKLLQALTRNHLTGIVAYHVERVASGRATKPEKPAPKPAKATAKKGDAFGMEILKAVANSSSAIFGLEGGQPPQKRAQASQRHIDAMKALAGKSPKSKN